MKQIIRLTENDLHRIVKESVNKILNEGYMKKNGFDIPHSERVKLNSYDKEGFDLIDEPDNVMWNGQFSYKADSLPSYIDYANRVNTDYDPLSKEREIENSWKELNGVNNHNGTYNSINKHRCFNTKDYRCLKPQYPIQTEKDLEDYRNNGRKNF